MATSSKTSEAVSFLSLIDSLAAKVPYTVAMLLSTLPRGGIQIVQPQRLPDLLVKSYGRDFVTEDRATWQALTGDAIVTTSDAWTSSAIESSRFYKDFLTPNGLRHVAAISLQSPVLEGYPGVLWIGRSNEQGEFTEAELKIVEQTATAIEEAATTKRSNKPWAPWVHQLPTKVFIFDHNANQIFPSEDAENLDSSLKDHMTQHARHLIQRLGKETIDPERVLLPDSNGDLWTFRATPFNNFPALGNGPVVFLCLQPQCADWAKVGAAELAADQELSRLVPALKFMAQNFKKSPTLTEIAKTVHLSPFHFHRRFTELVGLTPKHYLLECQIHEAKQQLISQSRSLPEIATDCGFAHQSHFTSRFKQTTGLTPTRWRRLALRLTGGE